MNKFITITLTISILSIAAISSAWAQNFVETKSAPKPKVKVEFVGEGSLDKENFTAEAVLLLSDAVGSGAGAKQNAYTIGVDDIIEISVLQPDEILRVVNVAPDGMIAFPYIGSIKVKDLTIPQIQEKIQSALADGYLKYPVVLVSLQESRSRKFFVYGEVAKPGNYAMAENTTVLRAISMAGGFTKFGSSARVKVLRAKKNKPGYEMIKIRIKKVMNGDSEEDILLKSGDMVVVSEGMF